MSGDKVCMDVAHEFDVVTCKYCDRKFVILGVLPFQHVSPDEELLYIPFIRGWCKTNFCPVCGSSQE